MRRALLISSALFASFGAYACSGPASSGDAPPPSTASEPAAAVSGVGEPSRTAGRAIATVVTQNARVTIIATGADDISGLRFVVRRADGALVADGVSVDKLRTIDPTLHAIVTNAFASAGGGFDPTKPYLDATL